MLDVKIPPRFLVVGCLQKGNFKMKQKQNKTKSFPIPFSVKPSVNLPSKIDHSLSIYFNKSYR